MFGMENIKFFMIRFNIISHLYQNLHGRAMAQAVSRRPPTAEARVRSRGQSMWDLWWTKWHWDRFSPVNFIPPVLHY
jgi:hypothetical protein